MVAFYVFQQCHTNNISFVFVHLKTPQFGMANEGRFTTFGHKPID
jgi:hypothetical protein